MQYGLPNLVVPPRPAAPPIRIDDIARALDQATDPADIKDINAKADAFEQYMHDCGLYGIEDMRPVNELRMRARWKLGNAVAKLYRAAGPGRGKKMSADKTSFRTFLTELDLDKSLAVGAQRIGALPEPELCQGL